MIDKVASTEVLQTMLSPNKSNVYLRCPAEFRDVLTDDLERFHRDFPSIRIALTLGHGIIIEASPEDIVGICYYCQSIEKAILILATSDLPDWIPGYSLPDIQNIISESETAGLKTILPQEFTYRTEIVADKILTGGEWRLEQAEKLSAGLSRILTNIGIRAEVNLRDPHLNIMAVLEVSDSLAAPQNKKTESSGAQVIIGIDLTGRDLSKRKYKITSTGVSVKGTIAYCVMHTLNPAPGSIFLDPNCGTGEVAIETALYASHTSPWKYEKKFSWTQLVPFTTFNEDYLTTIDRKYTQSSPSFRIRCVSPHFGHLAISRRHAKIAGVEHLIEFSRIEFKWLDAKFGKGEVDSVASCLPPPRSGISDSQKVKEAKLLFYQLEFLLKPQGKIILMTHTPLAYDQAAAMYNFRKITHRSLQIGALQVYLQTYEKVNATDTPSSTHPE